MLVLDDCCGQQPISDICGIAEPPRRGFFCAKCTRTAYADTFAAAADKWNLKPDLALPMGDGPKTAKPAQ